MFQVPPESPFYWKLLKIGIRSAKNIRENDLIFQVLGFIPAPPTLPVLRVVLLHTEASGERLFRGSVCIKTRIPSLFNVV